MTKHGALSIVAPIRPGMKQQLFDKCREIEAAGVETNPVIPFGKITSIHFARFVVFDESTDAFGNRVDPLFVFTTNYDQPFDKHLDELIAIAGPGLWQLFSLCAGFPQNVQYSADALLAYLSSVMVHTETFYVGVGYRSVLQIRQENELREAIENFIDQQQPLLEGKGPLLIRQKIIEFVNTNPSLSWAKTPVEKPSASWEIGFYAKLIIPLILLIALIIFKPIILLIVIAFLIVWLLIILFDELKGKDVTFKIDKNHIRELVERETGLVQAQFSAMGNIKPGWVRKQTMMFLLRMTNFLAPYLFSKGKLSGIPTVHFARWIIINEGRQMIFLSNFDGNSESYLRDFINIAGKQLSLMFCHTIGYPKTRLMVFGGADDANGFMSWARKFQTITNVWYSANKNVSVKNIFNNSRIRDGLYGAMNEKQAAKWLSLF
jgi:hypothetical protein